MNREKKRVKKRKFFLTEFKSPMFYRGMLFLLVMIFVLSIEAQQQKRTVGVISITKDTAAGYILFTPLNATGTYLVDNFGRLINSWSSDNTAGASVYLLPDGSILRCESLRNTTFNAGGSGGRIKRMSWDGKTMWIFDFSGATYCQHHDCKYLPNGNILILAWELKTQAEAAAKGRTTSGNVWSDFIVEVKPSGSNGGTIVWEWHAWDHLIQDKDPSKPNYGKVEEHPELIDVNYVAHQNATGDWLHTNAIDYNEEFDQIMLTARYFDEVWIIDHSTTTEEAASNKGGKYGKGGNLLYRFGNPAAYKKGSSSDRLLYLHHDAHWIPKGLRGEGNVLVFNNGQSGSRNYSSVDEFKLPVDKNGNYDMSKPPQKVWSFTTSNFYATNMSNAQRLKNGNTLICDGPKGRFFEVDSANNIVWEYINPVTNTGIVKQYNSIGGGFGVQPNQCFRANRYAPDYEAFKGKNLTPKEPLEGGKIPTVSTFNSAKVNLKEKFFLCANYSSSTSAISMKFNIPQSTDVTIKIYNAEGQKIATVVDKYFSVGEYNYTFNITLTQGIYFVKLVAKNYITVTDKILILTNK